MGLRKRKPPTEVEVMKTAKIQRFAELPLRRAPEDGLMLSAILFASGELVEADNESQVLGLVLAGYEGLRFGDDGTYTAQVASELPLERYEGVRVLEAFVNEGVQAINPAYVAEHVGWLEPDEASVYMRAWAKHSNGIYVPDNELHWGNGQLNLNQPAQPVA